MQRELLSVQQKELSSIMFVTHSIDEALILGDQIVMIEKGLVKHVYPVKTPSGKRNLLNEEFIALKRDIIENLNFINYIYFMCNSRYSDFYDIILTLFPADITFKA